MDPHFNPELGSRHEKLNKASLLSLCSLFSGLSQWELKSISQLMRLVEFRKDEIVYSQGGPGDSFYVIVSGRFEASILNMEKKKVLAYLRRGDFFGEMSLLTDEPHSATVKALSDSILLVLKKDDFKRMIEHNATVSFELNRRLSSRVKGLDKRSRSLLKSDIISIFGQQQKIGRTAFSINLAASLFHETHQKTILLDMSPSGSEVSTKLHMGPTIPISHFEDLDSADSLHLSHYTLKHSAGFEVLSIAHDEKDSRGEQIIISLLNHLAIDYRFILIDLPAFMDEMVLKALAQSDSVYFVTDSHINNITETQEVMRDVQNNLSFPDEKIAIVINEAFLGIRTTNATKKELFGKKACYSLPATPALKEHEETSVVPFVVEDPEAEYSRVVRHIARRVSNNLVGLALGSGAALGLAHIGVLKVLEREKIPIDMIAGSSVGAMVGSLYATGNSSADVEKMALEINTPAKLMRLLDINFFPVHGLLTGKRIVKHLKKFLGSKTFDDCTIPFMVTGANLSSRQVMVIDSGFVLDAVRTSISIPAIFRPIFLNKDTIIDGGILSPLPIQALHEAGANKVIAINVFPSGKDLLERRIILEEAAEKEERLMRQKNFISRGFYRFGKKIKKFFLSNIFDILMNTIQAMETEIAEIESQSADVVLRPVVANANWVEFFKADRFIKKGEEEAMRMLPKIKALVSQQNV